MRCRHSHWHRSSAPRRQAGLSLIELMVASLVGLLIMLAILTLYTNISRTNDEMAKTNALIENGRFAIQLLQGDVAHAGFWDVYIPDFDDLTATALPTAIPSAVPPPCLAFADWTPSIRSSLLGVAVQVFDAVPDGCSGSGGAVANWKSGTDILVVRHAETCVAGASGCEAADANRLYFQASRCGMDAASYVLGSAGLTLRERNCADLAPTRRYVSRIYYIRDYAATVGDGIPTLVRSEFDFDGSAIVAMPAVALIEGVEGFRVDLGIDHISDAGTDIFADANPANRYTAAVKWADPKNLVSPVNRGDGVPDMFVHCDSAAGGCSVGQLINVVAVKLSLLVRSQTATPGYVDDKSYTLGSQSVAAASDGFKRHAFSTVVRLNNISGRRETP